MRRPSRNIEIFSMSVLDMFGSALGAFIMITVILFPYFNQHRKLAAIKLKIGQVQAELLRIKGLNLKYMKLKNTLEKETLRITVRPGAIDKCLKLKEACKISLGKTFLVIGTEWHERCDVDMYVTDPQGNKFTFLFNNRDGHFKNSKAQLSLDMRDGPGIEIWQNPEAQVGTYKLQYDVVRCSAGFDAVHINGWSIDRSGGERDFPVRVVRSADFEQKIDVATFRVRPDGSVAIKSGGAP